MIKVNLLRDYSAPVAEKKQPIISTAKIPSVGYLYIAAIILLVVGLGYLWIRSNSAIKEANALNISLNEDLKKMEALRKQFVDLERKKKERLAKINIIEKLLESQKGPVRLMNVVVQSIPQSSDTWLTSLEQTTRGIKVKGSTRTPEVLPPLLEDLEKSGIFTSVDIEVIERRNDISNFSIVCVGRNQK